MLDTDGKTGLGGASTDHLIALHGQYAEHTGKLNEACFKATGLNVAVAGAVVAFIFSISEAGGLAKSFQMLMAGSVITIVSIASFFLIEYYSRKHRAYDQMMWVLSKAILRGRDGQYVMAKIREHDWIERDFLRDSSIGKTLWYSGHVSRCNLLPAILGLVLIVVGYLKS